MQLNDELFKLILIRIFSESGKSVVACKTLCVKSLASDFGNVWSQNLVQFKVFHCASAMQEKSCLTCQKPFILQRCHLSTYRRRNAACRGGKNKLTKPQSFWRVELLGSSERIKPVYMSQEQKGKIPNTSSKPPQPLPWMAFIACSFN